MFVRWAPRHGGDAELFGSVKLTGWEIPIAGNAAITALALVLVELAGVTSAWRSRGQRLVSFFLAAATGAFAVGGLVHLRWGGYYHLRVGQFAYGAWIGLALGILLLAAAALRLAELRSKASPPR
jgi:hypothetical protein